MMYRYLKAIFIIFFFLVSCNAKGAQLAENLLKQSHFSLLLSKPACKAYVAQAYKTNPQALIAMGAPRDFLDALGIVTYPPAWEAFQTELTAMDRRGICRRLVGGDALLADFPRAHGEPVSAWFARALDEKFRTQEDLKSAGEAKRREFDPIIAQLQLEEAVLAHQAGLPHTNLTDDQKYAVAEQMAVYGLHPIPALRHVIFGGASFMIRGHDLTDEVLHRMNGAAYLTRDQAIDEVKREAYTQEVANMFGNRLGAFTGPTIERMVAMDATVDDAVLHVFGNRFEVADHNYAPDVIDIVRITRDATLDAAFAVAQKNRIKAQYASRLEGVTWTDEFVDYVVRTPGHDINEFLRDKFARDIRGDIGKAIEQFNGGTPYHQVIQNIKIQQAQEIVHRTFSWFTAQEQKDLATFMVTSGNGLPRVALKAFLSRVHGADAVDEIMGQIMAGHTLNDAINTVTFGPIRARYPGLLDYEARFINQHMRDQENTDPEVGVVCYIVSLRDGVYTPNIDLIIKDLNEGQSLTQSLKKVMHIQKRRQDFSSLNLPDFREGSANFERIMRIVNQLSDDFPALSSKEIYEQAIGRWIAEVDGVDFTKFDVQKITTTMANRIVETKETKAQCFDNFNALRQRIRDSLDVFVRNNYERYDDAANKNQKLFAPIVNSDLARIERDHWGAYEEGYFPMIEALATYMALENLPFYEDADNTHWEENRRSLITALALALEEKDSNLASRARDYGDLLDRNAKTKRHQHRREAHYIAEKMFEGLEEEYSFGKSYSDALKEYRRLGGVGVVAAEDDDPTTMQFILDAKIQRALEKFRSFGLPEESLASLAREAVLNNLSNKEVLESHTIAFPDSQCQGFVHTIKERTIDANWVRIQGFMVKDEGEIDFPNDEPTVKGFIGKLFDRDVDVSNLTADEVHVQQLVEYMKPAFATHDALRVLRASLEDIEIFARKYVCVWRTDDQTNFDIPIPDLWADLYKPIPKAVEEDKEAFRALVLRKRPEIIERKNRFHREREAPIGAQYVAALGEGRDEDSQELFIDPRHSRYRERLEELLQEHQERERNRPFSVNFDFFGADPFYQSNDIEVLAQPALIAKIGTIGWLDIPTRGKLTSLVNKCYTAAPGADIGYLQRQASLIVDTLTKEGQEDKKATVVALMSDFKEDTCPMGVDRALSALSTTVIGVSGDLFGQLSMILRRWRIDVINEYFPKRRLLRDLTEDTLIGEMLESEHGVFLSVNAKGILGLDAADSMMSVGGVVISCLQDEPPSIHNSAQARNGLFETTWNHILGGCPEIHFDGMSVGSMVRVVQEKLPVAVVMREKDKNPLLYAMQSKGMALGVEGNITRAVAEALCWQLGCLNIRSGAGGFPGGAGAGAPVVAPQREGLPEWWPTVRQSIPRGTGEDVWVGTEDPR